MKNEIKVQLEALELDPNKKYIIKVKLSNVSNVYEINEYCGKVKEYIESIGINNFIIIPEGDKVSVDIQEDITE